jgi:phosphoribosylanthranilate isomerase
MPTPDRAPRLSAPSPAPAPRRVRVKICGVTDPASAVASVEMGAEYLGLNFCPRSPRHLADPGLAREIAAAARAAAPGVALVGVFVNPSAGEVAAAEGAAGGLDLVQFSGDEPPAAVRAFAARAIKALRLAPAHAPAAPCAPSAASAAAGPVSAGAAGVAVPFADFADCWAWLFDTPRARAGGLYGGTGLGWDYLAVAALPLPPHRRFFLAGGLGPGNVRQVLATLATLATPAGRLPFAIDVCSGVESAPGTKDPRLLRQLFEEVRNGQAPTAA